MTRKVHEQRTDLSCETLEDLRRSCVEMAVNRIEGEDDLYVGGIWALRRPNILDEKGITHVLSVVRCNPPEEWGDKYKHMVVDVDDVEDEDLLSHLPGAVRFINGALHPPRQSEQEREENEENQRGRKVKATGDMIGRTPVVGHTHDEVTKDDQAEESNEFKSKAEHLKAAAAANSDLESDAITPVPNMSDLSIQGRGKDPSAPGAVYVHCAMGKSRSVSAVAAYLLWKYPGRFGRASHDNAMINSQRTAAGQQHSTLEQATKSAVEGAVAYIRKTREMAEPNDGFMKQLELWWQWGCPAEDGRLESLPAYQKWRYAREVEESLAVGEAPSRLRFEDEERAKASSDGLASGAMTATVPRGEITDQHEAAPHSKELRCKKCRRVLATSTFVVDHQPAEYKNRVSHSGAAAAAAAGGQGCQHFFIEPLSWMRPTLESGDLEGRLMCPEGKCGATLGRFSWKGFRCTCGGWVTPAFSLARGRVDEVAAPPKLRGPKGATSDEAAARRAALGIRMPPGMGGGAGRL